MKVERRTRSITRNPQGKSAAGFSVPPIEGMCVECVLYSIRAGSVERVCSLTLKPAQASFATSRAAGQSSEHHFTVLIAEELVGQGKVRYSLSPAGGFSAGAWHSGKSYAPLELRHACALMSGNLTREMPSNEQQIIFIQGESIPFAAGDDVGSLLPSRRLRLLAMRRMTPRQLAEQNQGPFMVITARWYISLT